MKTIIQVPVEKKLRDEAEVVANDQGFSSLQDVVRLFLRRFAKREISVVFADEEQLSPRAARRYDKMIRDVESGKVKPQYFSNVKDFMKSLES